MDTGIEQRRSDRLLPQCCSAVQLVDGTPQHTHQPIEFTCRARVTGHEIRCALGIEFEPQNKIAEPADPRRLGKHLLSHHLPLSASCAVRR